MATMPSHLAAAAPLLSLLLAFLASAFASDFTATATARSAAPTTARAAPLAAVPAAATQTEAPPEVRYIANSGMLVTLSNRRFLIDAPIRDGIPPYATSSAAERTLLENARAPYDNIDAILITHWHEDHFSPEAVAAHLSHNTRTLLISSPEVIARIRTAAPNLPTSHLRPTLPAPGNAIQIDVNGLPVRVLRIRHNPTRRLPNNT